jgi:hypothetical protein
VRAGSICVQRCARRGRRCPVRAHGVAVSASLRLRCVAPFGLGRLTHFAHFVRYVQTRSGKSVHEVRFAHRAQKSATRRPTVSPYRAPPAARAIGSQCLGAVRSRLHKAAAGHSAARVCGAEEASPDTNSPVDCSCLASGRVARPGAACKARIRGRARSALRVLTCRFLFEGSERSERSELSDGHESEHRRVAGAKRRPPHPRAAECPAAALPRQPMHKNQTHWRR